MHWNFSIIYILHKWRVVDSISIIVIKKVLGNGFEIPLLFKKIMGNGSKFH